MVQTIMSDLGMGEDQSKIDALEQYLEENLSTFFSEDSYMSSVIKMTKALELADWNNVGMRMKGYAPIWPYNRL